MNKPTSLSNASAAGLRVAQVGDGTFPAPKDASDVGTADKAIKRFLEGIWITIMEIHIIYDVYQTLI